MPIILEPGQYSGITNDQYHGADLTPEYALSSSGARQIEKECELKFWWDSPMNPDRPTRDAEHFDIGKAMHILLLEPHDFGRSVHVVYADSWRTKDAQQQRDSARASKLIPMLAETFADVQRMRDAFWQHPLCQTLNFEDGLREVTLAWADPETGVWLRCRPDFLPNHGRYMLDPKSAHSANPADFRRAIWDYSYHCQAAWYLDAVKAVRDQEMDRFYFIAIEKKAPFLISVIELDQQALDFGRLQNRRAIRRFAKCMESGIWPGYRDRREPDTDKAFRLGLPQYAVTELGEQLKDGAL